MPPLLIVFSIFYFFSTLIAAYISIKIMICMIIVALIGFILALCILKHKAKVLLAVGFLAVILASSMVLFKTMFEYNTIVLLDQKSFEFSAVVKDVLGNGKFEVTVTSLSDKNAPQKFNAILTTFEDVSVDYYDRIDGTVKFSEIKDISKQNKKSQNVFLYGYATKLSSTAVSKKPINYYFIKANSYLCNIIDNIIDKPYDSLIKAVLLGEKSNLDPEVKAHLNGVGLAHLLAISGLHISIIAAFVMGICKHLFRPIIAQIITLFVVWGFTALTGFSVSTLRAAVMMSFFIASTFFHRSYAPINSLCTALVLILLFNPFAIFGMGLLLSFSATLGIVLYGRKIQNYIIAKFNIDSKIKNKLLRRSIKYFFGIFSCSLIASIFVLPFSVFYCSQIGFLAIAINLIAIPLFSIILPLSIIGLALSFLPHVSFYLGKIIWAMCFIVDKTSMLTGKLPFAMLPIGFEFLKYWVVVTTIYFIIMQFNQTRKKQIKFVCITSLLSLLTCTLLSSILLINTVEIVSFSGYKGKALVLFYSSKATIINLEDDSFINKSIMDYLDKKGVSDIDTLILAQETVFDIDGLKALTNGYNVKAIVNSGKNNAKEYVNKNISIVKAEYPVKIKQGKLFDITVSEYDNKMQIATNIGVTKINITQNCEDLKNRNYNLSYFYGKYDKYTSTFQGNYVIMLSKSDGLNSNYKNCYNKTNKLIFRTTSTIIREGEY